MNKSVHYAVVREDPLIEKELVEAHRPASALLVGSGGCTAFTLATYFPDLKLTLVDANPAQLQLVQRKAQALQRMAMDPAIFNIGSEDPQGLNACGSSETLFRCLRDFWRAFILRAEDLEHMFDSEKRLRSAIETLTSDPYWKVSFDLFFGDEMLTTMFGPNAFQHAPGASYPDYFRQAVERGFARPDALENPFLHHLVLGHYLETRREAWPLYLQRPPRDFQAEMLPCHMSQVPSFTPFHFVQLSNVFDWKTDEQARGLARRLDEELPSGAVVLWRQLNNTAPFEKHFTKVKFDAARGDAFLAKDRSLLYTRIMVGVKA